MKDISCQTDSSHAGSQRLGAPGARRDWFWSGISLMGFALLMVLLGIILAIYQLPPYRFVRDALIGLSAFGQQQRLLASPWPEHLWYPADQAEGGLIGIESKKSFGDYTVYTSGHHCVTSLVDRSGQERHRWEAPFSKLWPNPRHVPSWIPDRCVYIHRTFTYPNGDLLAVYETTVNTPSGCGLAKLDRRSNVLWTYDQNAHHDFCIDDNGTIYVLTHRLRRLKNEDVPGAEEVLTVPSIEDCIAILSPDGQQQKTISILDALLNSRFSRPALWHVDRYGDIMHNNTINLVGKKFAGYHKGVSEGDLMICLRNLNLVAVLNPEHGNLVWATTGPWNHPHDPDPLENGNILIFDNLLMQGTHDGSGVVEFDPLKRQILWYFCGDRNGRLRSDVRSCQQALSNGNVLITESAKGRIIEVNRDGEIVWEFRNPVRGGHHEELIPLICGARRYTREELPFVEQLPPTTASSSLASSFLATTLEQVAPPHYRE